MPYRDPSAKRAYQKQYMRQRRAWQKAVKRPAISLVPSDPVSALAAWAREALKVPAGHPLAGSPMELPAFAEAFLAGRLDRARKRALRWPQEWKVGNLCGAGVGLPVRSLAPCDGWRGAIASVSKEKARSYGAKSLR